MTPAEPPPANASAPKQYLYVLRLAPRLHDRDAWTEQDRASVSAHLEHLRQAAERRQVILAGRTSEPLAQTFGIVIFEAGSDAEARAFMENDPTVRDGVMSAELHPYAVAVMRGPVEA